MLLNCNVQQRLQQLLSWSLFIMSWIRGGKLRQCVLTCLPRLILWTRTSSKSRWPSTVVCERERAVSERYNVELRVAQGSILGPLIFNCFTNDLKHNISDGCLINFADDSTVALSAMTALELECKVDNCKVEFESWCSKSRPLLNLNKTGSMQFKLRPLVEEASIKVKPVRFSGLYVDTGVTWKNQIDSVVSKLIQLILQF
ncbi:Reverse transcriptase (RNA-dependent DNA polymerase) [Popillia japonica]|uniref:Reverse transcriptase (RNA-dependent DNA polymerase) n=1 Tax=Popillia japonica TaxID=7064 RepID=A0AAW1JVM0_POPJA